MQIIPAPASPKIYKGMKYPTAEEMKSMSNRSLHMILRLTLGKYEDPKADDAYSNAKFELKERGKLE